jgi:hypothetical protein
MQTDLTFWPIACNAFTSMGIRLMAHTSLDGYNFSQAQGGSARRIFFEFVMPLDNLDISVGQKASSVSH